MKITDFAKKVSKQEGLKKGVDIAQILEILKVTNNILNNELYKLIKKEPDELIKKNSDKKNKFKDGFSSKTKMKRKSTNYILRNGRVQGY